MVSNRIEELSVSDRSAVLDVLVSAFHDYPVFRYVLQDADGETYEQRLRLLIGYFADSRLMRGWPVLGVRIDRDLAGVLLLSDPVFSRPPELLVDAHRRVASVIGASAFRRLEEFESALDAYEPDVPTYFVGMIGVKPSSQGSGLAGLLMEHVAEMSRQRPESAGITLSTEDPDNLAFYRHFGYRVIGQADVGNFTSWLLLLET